jgi:hypothetical protein
VTDPRYALAFDEAIRAIGQQEGSLKSLRDRASGLVSTAAVATTFGAGVGLLNTDPTKGAVFPVFWAVVLLLLVVGILATGLIVLWPTDGWVFSLNARVLVEGWIENPSQSATIDDLHRENAIYLQAQYEANKKKLRRRIDVYRFGIFLLTAEVVVFVGVLLSRSGG